jgi:hypothetical protein
VLHALVFEARLIGVIGALFLGEGVQGAHGLPHLGGVHPGRQVVGVELGAVFEEFDPAILLGLHRLGGEFGDLQQPDAAVLAKHAAGGVAQADVVGVVGVIGEQDLAQQPDGVGRSQLAVVLALLSWLL